MTTIVNYNESSVTRSEYSSVELSTLEQIQNENQIACPGAMMRFNSKTFGHATQDEEVLSVGSRDDWSLTYDRKVSNDNCYILCDMTPLYLPFS